MAIRASKNAIIFYVVLLNDILNTCVCSMKCLIARSSKMYIYNTVQSLHVSQKHLSECRMYYLEFGITYFSSTVVNEHL